MLLGGTDLRQENIVSALARADDAETPPGGTSRDVVRNATTGSPPPV